MYPEIEVALANPVRRDAIDFRPRKRIAEILDNQLRAGSRKPILVLRMVRKRRTRQCAELNEVAANVVRGRRVIAFRAAIIEQECKGWAGWTDRCRGNGRDRAIAPRSAVDVDIE